MVVQAKPQASEKKQGENSLKAIENNVWVGPPPAMFQILYMILNGEPKELIESAREARKREELRWLGGSHKR
ncbi:MAG: hypothetical protein ACD_12C00653G0001 [uncultured bacterium]|nr:MAG: hypothetical protein ACD_12C00653G0001 [uncultured bacterium]